MFLQKAQLSLKRIFAAAGLTAALSGCATGPGFDQESVADTLRDKLDDIEIQECLEVEVMEDKVVQRYDEQCQKDKLETANAEQIAVLFEAALEIDNPGKIRMLWDYMRFRDEAFYMAVQTELYRRGMIDEEQSLKKVAIAEGWKYECSKDGGQGATETEDNNNARETSEFSINCQRRPRRVPESTMDRTSVPGNG